MKRGELARNLEALSSVFGIKVRYFSQAKSTAAGFGEVTIGR